MADDTDPPLTLADIVEALKDTCQMGDVEAEELGIGFEDLEEAMLDANYERCDQCGYWLEANEFLDRDENSVESCLDCRGGDQEEQDDE